MPITNTQVRYQDDIDVMSISEEYIQALTQAVAAAKEREQQNAS